jgi:hypothetical protein
MTECNDIKEQRRHNTGLAKVAIQSSADTFVVNQSWFSASTFVVKIATFAKPETVMCNPVRQPNKPLTILTVLH